MKIFAPKKSMRLSNFWLGQRCPGCERFSWFTFGLKRANELGGVAAFIGRELLCRCGWTYNLER